MSVAHTITGNHFDWVRSLENERGEVYQGNMTGTSHHYYDRYKKHIKAGTVLVLKHDETNPYDKNAVGVWFRKDNNVLEQIGWIPKTFNGPVSDAIRRGLPVSCIVTSHDPDHFDYQKRLFISCNIDQHFTKEQFQMATTKVSNIVSKNVDLGTSAAFLEAGRIANKQLSGVAGKKLPIMVRAYADTPLGRLILANIALLAQEHFRPDDTRLQKLANAMTVSAYQEVLQQFDIEQFIDDLLSNATIKKALKTVESEG